jgi:major vault protein
MLQDHEELWEYPLGNDMEILLKSSLEYIKGKRVAYKVINYRIPFNSAVQIYDYKSKQSRIVFGPNMVMLQPDETFTMTSLSGKTPKAQGQLKTIHINLGPEFSTDVVTVETSDHAALRLRLSYNWQFNVDKTDPEQGKKIFNVKDFVGDLCNLMANQVRSAVASADFDTFHKTSARLIRKSVFGEHPDGKIKDSLQLEKNNLMITNIDIQNVEPVDE